MGFEQRTFPESILMIVCLKLFLTLIILVTLKTNPNPITFTLTPIILHTYLHRIYILYLEEITWVVKCFPPRMIGNNCENGHLTFLCIQFLAKTSKCLQNKLFETDIPWEETGTASLLGEYLIFHLTCHKHTHTHTHTQTICGSLWCVICDNMCIVSSYLHVQ